VPLVLLNELLLLLLHQRHSGFLSGFRLTAAGAKARASGRSERSKTAV